MTNPVTPPNPDGAVPLPPPSGAPPRKRRQLAKSTKLLLGLLVLIVGYLVVKGTVAATDPVFQAKNAAVGSCLNSSADPKTIEVVDCANPDAARKVVGKVPGIAEVQFKLLGSGEYCGQFTDSGAALWIGGARDVGTIVCTEPLKR